MTSRKKSRGRSGTPKGEPKHGKPSYTYAVVSDPLESELDIATAAAYEEALDDIHTRFILNLPPDELATSDRIFFQLEQAWWFYDDFICDAEDNEVKGSDGDGDGGTSAGRLPRFRGLCPFARKMFDISPLLRPMTPRFDAMWSEFNTYRRSISTYGTILLNGDCSRVALCLNWSGKSWTFPAGKVNQNERGIDAGARETYEETGFDPNCSQGTARIMRERADEAGTKLPWGALREEDALVYAEEGTGKRRTCYVCRGVPETFPFEPVARKEISEVEWHDLSDLPKKSYAVFPLLNQLKRWIRRNGPHCDRSSSQRGSGAHSEQGRAAELTPSQKRNRSRGKDRDRTSGKGNGSSGPSSRQSSRGKVREGDGLAESGLGSPGDDRRWTAEEMFQVNERLTGKKVEYDGNPHMFALEGFRGIDPHAFRVVGGKFLNSDRGDELAPAPRRDKLQPLFARTPGASEDEGGDADVADGGGELTPFFVGGMTPWGEVVQEALQEEAAAATAAAAAAVFDSKKKKKKKKKKDDKTPSASLPSLKPAGPHSNDKGMALLSMIQASGEVGGDNKDQITLFSSNGFDVFLTDNEITAHSQNEKLVPQLVREDKRVNIECDEMEAAASMDANNEDLGMNGSQAPIRTRRALGEEDEHMASLSQWVKSLPDSPPTALFGDFRVDVDAVMAAVMSVQN